MFTFLSKRRLCTRLRSSFENLEDPGGADVLARFGMGTRVLLALVVELGPSRVQHPRP